MTQKEAFEILKSGHNVYLTGAAGSGKTYLLNQFIDFLRQRKIAVGITASTGIAATHLGGLTIHSWAGIGITRSASDQEIRVMADKPRVAKRLDKTEVLIIDEISMLDADRLSLIDRVARVARASFKPFGGLQVVFCGDFFQLPPVANRNDETPPRFAYHSPVWRELELKICYLKEQHRHGDDKLLGLLNAIREARVNEEARMRLKERCQAKMPNGRVTKLYSHNVDVDAENLRELQKLSGPEKNFQMEGSGPTAILQSLKNGCLAPENLALKKNAVVMFVKNNFEKGYVNGTLGKINDFDDDGYPVVTTLSGRKIAVSPENWSVDENGRVIAKITQLPLRLAWAITIHKSQGATLDAAEINLSDAFEKGMGYVALSRVRSLQGMKLLGFNEISLQVHPEILVFDNQLKQSSEMVRTEISSISKSPKIKRVELPITRLDEIRKAHRAAYQKWTPEEERQLIESFQTGRTISQLARLHGRQRGGIRARLEKLGLVEKLNR